MIPYSISKQAGNGNDSNHRADSDAVESQTGNEAQERHVRERADSTFVGAAFPRNPDEGAGGRGETDPWRWQPCCNKKCL